MAEVRADLNSKLVTAAAFVMLLPIIFSLIPVVIHYDSDILPDGDIALLESATMDVESGIFSGPYSRLGFHHPGPVYFYLRYPLYLITGYKHFSFYVTTALIIAVSQLISLKIIVKALGRSAMLLLALVISFFMFTLHQEIWLSQWNPFIIIFPFFLLVVSLSASASGNPGFFPVSLVCASFLTQTHLGTVPSVAVLAGWCAIRITAEKQWSKSLILIASGTLLLLWGPVVYGELTPPYGTGNLGKIITVMSQGEAIGITKLSMSAWVTSSITIESMFTGSFVREHFSAPAKVFSVMVALRFALLCAVIYRRRSNRSGFLFQFSFFTGLLYLASIASVFLIRGELHQYLTSWIAILGPLTWFAILAGVFIRYHSRLKKAPVWAVSVFLLLSSLTTIRQQVMPNFNGDPLDYHSESIELIMETTEIATILTDDAETRIRLVDRSSWPAMTGLVLQLEKRGEPVGIPDEFSFMYDHARNNDSEYKDIVI